jgi:outer membrane protein OmpA-like peptidoglycan-associated protein
MSIKTIPIICLVLVATPVLAQEPSSEEIICKLDPHCPIKPGFRKLDVTGAIPDDPLSVNLYVNFAYDSAELESDARITLDKLGQALKDNRLSSFSFSIVGHTDAKGSDEYNQRLSERRALAVKTYLESNFGISASRLSSKGMGKLQLLDPSRPEDAVNRRVQVLNISAEAH